MILFTPDGFAQTFNPQASGVGVEISVPFDLYPGQSSIGTPSGSITIEGSLFEGQDPIGITLTAPLSDLSNLSLSSSNGLFPAPAVPEPTTIAGVVVAGSAWITLRRKHRAD
jgi:hypothetical protein